MKLDTMQQIIDQNSKVNKELKFEFDRYAFDAFVIPILPVAVKEGLSGHVQLEGMDGTVQEIIFKHFTDTAPDLETANLKMNEFLKEFE